LEQQDIALLRLWLQLMVQADVPRHGLLGRGGKMTESLWIIALRGFLVGFLFVLAL
jgi:hypothetical protein